MQPIISEYPSNYIPVGAKVVRVTEEGATLRGFYDLATGILHVQEITHDLQQGESNG